MDEQSDQKVGALLLKILFSSLRRSRVISSASFNAAFNLTTNPLLNSYIEPCCQRKYMRLVEFQICEKIIVQKLNNLKYGATQNGPIKGYRERGAFSIDEHINDT